jgi:hypothetical protein
MSRFAILHISSFFQFICLFIKHQTVSGYNRSNFIYFYFATNEKDFILGLNWWKAFRNKISISNTDSWRILIGKFMNNYSFLLFIVEVKTWFLSLHNEIRLEWKHIMKKPSELIDVTVYINSRPCVVLHEPSMSLQFFCELLCQCLVILQKALILQYVEIFISAT